MSATDTDPIQGSLFEEDYLVRTLGSHVTSPDVALTELVANAWDAGAVNVRISIPERCGEVLSIEDDGAGMLPDQFKIRWMTLGYNRVKHQGLLADSTSNCVQQQRRAYGKSGVGRHSLLCFANHYVVRTCREGACSEFEVASASGRDPFVLRDERIGEGPGHGTLLAVAVVRNLPDPEQVRSVLAGRFLSDPGFRIYVNDQYLPITDHKGLVLRDKIEVAPDRVIEALVFKIDDTSKRVFHHGIAFWVNGRLVGHPTWTLGDRVLLDGRTRWAKQHTIVVKADDYLDLVLSDWTGFRPGHERDHLFQVAAEHVGKFIGVLARDHVDQTKEEVFRRHRSDIERLTPLAQIEVDELVSHMILSRPIIPADLVSVALEAFIRITQSRSGAELIRQLAELSDDDVEGLNRILSQWTVRDALTVLDEIDNRIAVVEALTRLSSDSKVDELNTLHPLVAQARWLFGPEYDSPEWVSNVTLVNAVEEVFRKRVSPDAFDNARKRPDLVVLPDATLSVTGTETFRPDDQLVSASNVLLIELKRGHSLITRKDMAQAVDYVEELLGCGVITGQPHLRAFVVGHRVDARMQVIHKIGEPEAGRVSACTYSQLVQTAKRRLFSLRERLSERYSAQDVDSLLQRVLREPDQTYMAMCEEQGA